MKITMQYINLAKAMASENDKDEWIISGVKTVDEAIELNQVDFTPYMVIEGVQLVRKRK